MINKVILIGNVGADPEVRVLEGGVKVANIRIATTERIYNAATQERRDHTEWHSVTLWRGLADVAERYVKKGSQVYIEGKIRSREWEDAATNTKRRTIDILADDMKLLGSRRPDSQYDEAGAPAPSYQRPAQTASYAPPATASVPATAPQPDLEPIDDGSDLPF